MSGNAISANNETFGRGDERLRASEDDAINFSRRDTAREARREEPDGTGPDPLWTLSK